MVLLIHDVNSTNLAWYVKYLDVTSVIDACQSNMLEKSIHRKIDATFLKIIYGCLRLW